MFLETEMCSCVWFHIVTAVNTKEVWYVWQTQATSERLGLQGPRFEHRTCEISLNPAVNRSDIVNRHPTARMCRGRWSWGHEWRVHSCRIVRVSRPARSSMHDEHWWQEFPRLPSSSTLASRVSSATDTVNNFSSKQNELVCRRNCQNTHF